MKDIHLYENLFVTEEIDAWDLLRVYSRYGYDDKSALIAYSKFLPPEIETELLLDDCQRTDSSQALPLVNYYLEYSGARTATPILRHIATEHSERRVRYLALEAFAEKQIKKPTLTC